MVERHLGSVQVARRRTVGKKKVETQVGDIALATMLKLTEQDLKDYGFTDVGSRTAAGYRWHSMLSQYWIETDEKRQTSREKWKAWREKNLPNAEKPARAGDDESAATDAK